MVKPNSSKERHVSPVKHSKTSKWEAWKESFTNSHSPWFTSTGGTFISALTWNFLSISKTQSMSILMIMGWNMAMLHLDWSCWDMCAISHIALQATWQTSYNKRIQSGNECISPLLLFNNFTYILDFSSILP